MSYRRFAAMIATSTVAMFGLMYLDVYEVGHIRFSETRLFMALWYRWFKPKAVPI